jgi:hypothetical protein
MPERAVPASRAGVLAYPGSEMTALGFAILISGWLLVVATLALLHAGIARNGFIVASLGVEALGLALVARAHLRRKADQG